MVWGSIAGAALGGIFAGQASKDAAGTAAGAQREGIAEQRRQFDIAQKQQEPWRRAGESALGRYEGMLGQQGQYEGQIRSNIPDRFRSNTAIPGAYQSQTNVPGAYRSATNVPGAYQSGTNIPDIYRGQSGQYGDQIQSDVRQGFQFGRQEFDQYKDPGYDFRKEEGLRALERGNAAGGKRTSGYNTRSLMELGQNLASQEFGAARGRAMQDYQSGVDRESQQYNRGVEGYGRDINREAELYGRGRSQVTDAMYREQQQYGRGRQFNQDQTSREQQMYQRGGATRQEEVAREQSMYGRGRTLTQDQQRREQELYQRSLGDYGLNVSRENAQYGRDIDRYGRQYTDTLNREAALSNVGQSTATNLASQGMQQGRDIGNRLGNIGEYGAAGQLGAAGAYAGALGSIGRAWDERNNGYQDPRLSFSNGGYDKMGNPL